MVQYVQQLTVFLFRTWYTVNKKKWGLNMLKSWTPGEGPDKDEMKVQLEKTRNRLYDLQMKIKEHKLPVLVLFEGWSAAGKGSMIGKVIRNIDPRFFKVATMSAPTEEEVRRPFLYRYMKQIPEEGKFTFLDSGWMEQTVKEVLTVHILRKVCIL